jgi:WD40 repeat protein
VSWSPDGEQLAVIADNNLLHLYEGGGDHAALGEPIESIDAPFYAAAFSPDGTRLATGSSAGVVQQWAVDTHEPVGAALKGHTGPVGGVIYSPDGRWLAASTLGFARSRLWDAETGAAIGQELVTGRTPSTFSTFLIEHVQGSRPAFAPDGRSLAVPSYDGTTAIWDLEPEHWLEAACDVVGRNLTRDEWEQYLGRFDYRATCG